MRIKFGFILLAIVFSVKGIAQDSNNNVLFTVDDAPVYASEFVRVYNKNLDLVKDESQKDIDNYLNLFVDYKLKLEAAKKLELNKKPSYLRELASYRKQLTKNYLTDTNVTDALVKEGYERISNEVKASHVLVKLPPNAKPADTLKAYNQIIKLRERVLKEGFETVKKEAHNGQTIFVEDLGYFSGFKMVYPFESAAYNTEIGDLSMPFKTRFGYHVIKVFEKRKSRGKVEVAHIMLSKNSKPNDSSHNPEQLIKDIYQKIEQGENFESLAKQFSEDKSSASKGGKLTPFSGGQLSSLEFENVAFGLDNKEEVSKPFETDFGWHIMKLYNKEEIASFEEMKPEIELKVKRDSRSKLINEAFVNKLKKKYNIKPNTEALNYFVSIVNKDYYQRKWVLPATLNKNRILLTIGEKQFTYGDFANQLLSNQKRNNAQQPLEDVVANLYNTYVDNHILKYYEDNLENENPEFAAIVGEYRDGLLLFDLMETEIWNAAKKDSIGLQTYYNTNKDTYFLNERVDALVASSSNQKTIKKVAKYLKSGWNEKQIKDKLNTKSKVNVVFTSGIMDANHQALPEDFQFKKGISKISKHNNFYMVANVKSVLAKEFMSFEDAKGRVISDYQVQKEKDWLKDLREQYEVKINKEVLDSIKSQM